MTRQLGADDDGWHDAITVVEGRPSARARQRQRTSRNRRIAIIAVLGLLPFAVLTILWTTDASLPSAPQAEPVAAQQVARVGVSAVGFVLVAAGFVRLVRSGQWGQAWRAPMLSLSRRERRTLLARIRAGEPVGPGQEPVAADLARRLARQGPMLLLFGGVIVNTVGQALGAGMTWVRWIFVALVLFGLVVLVLVARELRRGRRWLERYESRADGGAEPPR